MPASTHATLGASSASRWINCPGSVRAIAALPEWERNRSSTYADEGTAAHALAELCLSTDKDAEEFAGRRIKGELGEYEVDDEMVDAVQVYLDEVRGQVARLGPTAQLYVEARVHPIPDDPNLYGTADAIVLDELGHAELVVTDFKYGRGVVVDVDWNDQAMYYGLGALREAPGVDTITLVVVQPRAPHADGPVRRFTINRETLLWYAGTLIGAAARTAEPDAPLKAGSWCGFCPVRGVCPSLEEKALQVAGEDFSDLIELGGREALPTVEDAVTLPDPENVEQLARAWLLLPYLDHFTRGVEGMVKRRLEFGHDFPWAKLVRKRSTRRWPPAGNEEAAAKRAARRVGVSSKVLWEPRKLKSPAQLEKTKALKPFVADYAEKPEGGLTLAPIEDPREAVAVAPLIEEFADVPELAPGDVAESE